MQSMTGYGSWELQRGEYHLQLELRTVNHKYREIKIHLQEPSSRWEELLTHYIKNHINRGRVDLYLFIHHQPFSYHIISNLELAKEYL